MLSGKKQSYKSSTDKNVKSFNNNKGSFKSGAFKKKEVSKSKKSPYLVDLCHTQLHG